MERNVESHFSELPDIEITRSRFNMPHGHKTTFDVGSLIPLDCMEILPGDTIEVTTSAVIRLQTLLAPIFDNLYMDTYWFFVPNRLVWTHWKEFMGENTSTNWIPTTTYQLPRTLAPAGGWSKGTIADYLGIPISVKNDLMPPHSLPFRGYALICREWFTDQNVTPPLYINLGDTNTQGTNGVNFLTDVEAGGMPFKVAKYHDYFTSCLPYIQKSPDIGLFANQVGPFATTIQDHLVPVYSTSTTHNYSTAPSGVTVTGSGVNRELGLSSGGTTVVATTTTPTSPLELNNLWANLGYADLTISTLRLAFQMQKFFERAAMYGSRYRETIKSQFGVTTSDARMMVPEYLGGHRFPLSIHQVANQTQSSTEFLGDLGAMSVTNDIHEDFIKSFEEHGYLFCVGCVRYSHSYPQGLPRHFMRYNMLDYYFPVFQNLSNSPVYKCEIDYTGSQLGNEVFGYQEAWAEYRYVPSRVSSEFRPGYGWSLSSWQLSDFYTSVPSLSDSWIREDKSNVDNVLAVTSSVANQVLGDFWFDMKATRPMPVYSIPGLIDHH